MEKRFLLKLLAVASNFIFEMLVGLVLGFLIGQWLDAWFEFNLVFTIILMVGIPLVAIRNFIVRMLRLGAKHDDRKNVS